jgi:hypothetical protein
MSALPAGIPDADWLAIPALRQENDELRVQLTGLTSLRERIGRSSRNSSKPPPVTGLGLSLQSDSRAVTARESL